MFSRTPGAQLSGESSPRSLLLYAPTLAALSWREDRAKLKYGARTSACAWTPPRAHAAYPNTSFLFSGTYSPSSKSENSLFLSVVSAAAAPVVILYYCKCLRAGAALRAANGQSSTRAGAGICARWGNREIQSEDQRIESGELHLLHHEEDLRARAVTNTARNAFSFVLAAQRARQQARKPFQEP